MLSRLLERRFGSLPEAVLARIAAARPDELERWAETTLDAHSLQDVFRET